MIFLYASLLMVGAIVGLLLTLIGLPGNWLIVLAAGIYAYAIDEAGRLDVGLTGVVVLAVLALVGEVLEFLAGMWGAKRAGGSRRAAALALAGSIAGGVLGAIVGLPIPVLGPVLAAVLFASSGALVGGLAGELWKGRSLQQGFEVGKGAFHGRLVGTFAKLGVGVAMLILLGVMLIW